MNATTLQPTGLKALSERVLQRNHVRNHNATTPEKQRNFYPEKHPQKLRTVGVELYTKSVIDLCRWFVLEADRVYRLSPKTADSWKRCKEHTIVSETFIMTGDISAARAELEKALTALQGVTASQQNLL